MISEGGSHWLLLLFAGSVVPSEFFDPLGRLPDHYNEKFVRVLKVNGTDFIANRTRVQAENSTNCGAFVAFISDLRCIGYTLNEAVAKLSSTNLPANDTLVENYFINHISKP